jgi:hypothetical protein
VFIVTKKAERPASISHGICFYCGRPIGTEHLSGCVLIKKKVLVRTTITYEIEVPSEWTSEDIEFHRNEGSWCCNNMIGELEEIIKEDDICLCPITKSEYIRDTSKPYLDES